MTNEQAVELVQTLIAAYPRGDKISRETAAVYVADLLAFDYREARSAISRVRQSSEFFPTIATIVGEIVAARMSGLPDWTGAWLEATRYASALRTWRQECDRAEHALSTSEYDEWVAQGSPRLVARPPSPCREVMEAVEVVGGVWAIADSEQLGVTRAHFRDAYKSIVAERERTLRSEYAALGSSAQRELAAG